MDLKQYIITYGICLNCNEYIIFRNDYDYDYFYKKSIIIDAIYDYTSFEILESTYGYINKELFELIKNRYDEIKYQNKSKDDIKKELEKVIKEYDIKILKRV